MNRIRSRLRITTLVWILVAIGLVAGVITNGLVVWTLSQVNSERLALTEQEGRVLLVAQQLRQSAQQAQQVVGEMLRLDQPLDLEVLDQPRPLDDFDQFAHELFKNPMASKPNQLSEQLDQTSSQLRELWNRAADWRVNYKKIESEEREKKTLNEVRKILLQLRQGIEAYEARQYLNQALLISQWSKSYDARKNQLSDQILSQFFRPANRGLNEIKTELVDLSRLVEILAGETRQDQLADLKDNQLKPSLERLEYQLDILGHDHSLFKEVLPLSLVEALKEKLFGQGYLIVPEYQTIKPGRDGLYHVSVQRLSLKREREGLQQELFQTYREFEQVYPQLFDLARDQSKGLAEKSELTLLNSIHNLQLLSVLTLIGFLGLGSLISRAAHKQVEQLTHLRRQNELLLDSAGEGILGLDRGGQIIFANPAGARQLMQSQDALVGRYFRDILLGPDGEEASPSRGISIIEAALAHGHYHRSDDKFFRRNNGELFPVVFSVAAMQQESQAIEGAVLVFQDITPRKKAEKRLQEYYQKIADQEEMLTRLNLELEQKVAERTQLLETKNRELLETQEELARTEKFAAIDSLAAGVAHEINTPTAIIRGNIEILKMSMPEDAEGHEEIDEVLRQTERISLITQNMLDFSRKQNFDRQEVSINQLLEEILEQINHQMPLDQVEIRFDPAMDLPVYLGDAERLRQVFINLIVNGLQAMEGIGELSVESRFHETEICVSIADSGPGVSDEIQAHIFNPFFTSKANGTGLGLFVSYGIIRAHGGEIEVQSHEGRGSRFIVHLDQPIPA